MFRLAILGLATTSLLSCTDADDDSTPVDDDDTQIDRADGRPLTPASTDAPASIVRSYLSGRVGGDQLKVTSESTSRGVTHVRLEQVVDGLRVHGAYAKAALTSRGELLQVIHHITPTSKTTKLIPAQAIESDALRTALVELGYGIEPARARMRGNVTAFAQTSEMYREPTVERVAYRDGATLRVGFLVETWSQANNQLDHTLIGGDGRIVSIERRTANDQYRVFVEDPSPGKGGQVVVTGPGAGNAESPAGWLNAGAQNTINIAGNNTRSYLDAQSNNAADKGGTSVTNGSFLTAADLNVSPSTTGNRAVAVQNLFYLNNIVHDRLYRHGFNELNGNFQTNNFGKGGAGNDAVNAEAQDGGGTDNANFSTPPDGSAPRMQMYLWSSTTPSGFVTVGSAHRNAYGSAFGPALTLAGVSGPMAVYNDGVGVSSDGCEASTGVALTGKVVLIDRGTCNFTVKVMNAQNAGAKAVLIVNNVDGNAFPPSGTERRVKIPSAMVSLADGGLLKGQVGIDGLLRKNPAPTLQVDGDLDADIVFHEYGHGLTWRMIGGMNGTFAGAIGEGASDVLAFLINGDDRIGEYSAGDPVGIRSKPYGDFTETYADWTANEVHDDGEIYAAAMWRVYQNYLAAGLTADDVLGDFVDGMNFTQSTPRPEHMRDGMLQASDPARACLIWRGFAARGIGEGASGLTPPITQSFTMPAVLGCAAP